MAREKGSQAADCPRNAPNGRLRSVHQLLREFPSVMDAVVFSSAPFGEIPEQRIRFIPIYFAGSVAL